MQTNDIEGSERIEQRRTRHITPLWIAFGCLAVVACLTCLVVAAAAGIIIVSSFERSTSESLAASADFIAPLTPPPLPPANPTASVPSPAATRPSAGGPSLETAPTVDIPPTSTSETGLSVPAEIRQSSPPDSAFLGLSALMAADYPARDYYETARRLGQTEVGKRTVSAQSYQVGERRNFRTDDGLREAVLMAVTEHAYFWVETTLDYDPDLIADVAQQFEAEYYPAMAKLYGTAWQNGIDDDPRFAALHLDGYSDGTELGFFNSGDQYPRSVSAGSNEQEVVYLNMENLRPGDSLYFGTLVHELQHLIQWHDDANEPIWLSEGLAQFTELYVGLDTVDTAVDYLDEPGTRLNTWLHDAGDEIFAHYGASYLFVVYFWERFGDLAIQSLMQHPADGLAGVSAVLTERDPLATLDQFVLDWATATYLDSTAYGPRYQYEHLKLDTPEHAVEIDESPYSTVQNVDQFGVSYIELDLQGQTTLAFAGDSTVELLPVPPHSGDTMWYVPSLNELDAQLTASFDLTGLASAELSFWAWYDLENGYDFAYVSVSADGGATWDLLMPDHAEAGEYGPALTGSSAATSGNVDGWIQESVSLTPYTGGPVQVRFEVLSDSAIAEAGFAIDDIAIAELDFFDDVEEEMNQWQASGFVRTGQLVPQVWRLNLILHGPAPQVIGLDLDERGQGSWTLDLGNRGAVLVVTAQTPFINTPANYWLDIGD